MFNLDVVKDILQGTDYETTNLDSVEVVRKTLDEEVKTIRKKRGNVEDSRRDFQEKAAAIAMLKEKMPLAKIIRQIMRLEETRNDFRRIQWYMEMRKRKRQTDNIEIPTSEG